VIEHRHGGSHDRGVRVRHVDGAGAEPDLLRCGRDPGKKRDGRGDVFGLIGDVFADIGLAESELIGQKEGFAIFAQRDFPVLAEWVNWHGEEPKIHRLLLPGPIDEREARIGPCIIGESMPRPKLGRCQIIVAIIKLDL